MKKIKFMALLATSFFTLISCQTTGSFQQQRFAGIMSFERAFNTLTPAEDFYYELEGRAKIFVYGSNKQLLAAADKIRRSRAVKDYAPEGINIKAFTIIPESGTPEVHLVGARDPKTGKIYINESWLGHEVFHLIHWQNKRDFMNPDQGLPGYP